MLKALRIRHLIMISTILTPLVLVGGISLRLAIARQQAPTAQAILTLGGGIDRERFTAQFAINRPDLEIWISTGSPAHTIFKVFNEVQAPVDKLNLDYQATNTVTNFTATVHQLKQQQIQHVYIVTSDFHGRRAQAIAFWVLGSRGITYTLIPTPSKRPPEPLWKTPRDVGRAIFWLFTGQSGLSSHPRYTPNRKVI